MKEFDSRDIAKKVEEHFDYKVPQFQGAVLLHPIVLAVLDVLKEEGFLELEHRTDTGIDVTPEVSADWKNAPSAAVVPSEGKQGNDTCPLHEDCDD